MNYLIKLPAPYSSNGSLGSFVETLHQVLNTHPCKFITEDDTTISHLQERTKFLLCIQTQLKACSALLPNQVPSPLFGATQDQFILAVEYALNYYYGGQIVSCKLADNQVDHVNIKVFSKSKLLVTNHQTMENEVELE